MNTFKPLKQLRNKFEQQVFRRLNSVVEPLVREGVVSSRVTPASLLVLQTTGFRSGKERRTPLWSLRLGPYRLISTGRGKRSFWVRNLQQTPATKYFIGGDSQEAEAIVVTSEYNNVDDWDLSPWLTRTVNAMSAASKRGWAFVLLVPAAT